ncbi:MAG TPA: roadblock/LC7 domain-containing protein [bacterium]|nr:roadblock/LC7 domain-containing protein [bacterium]
MTDNRRVQFQAILKEFQAKTPDVEAVSLVSTDGFVLADCSPGHVDEETVGAVSAAILSLGNRATAELDRGAMEQLILKTERGYMFYFFLECEVVLCIVTGNQARIGLILLDVGVAIRQLTEVLQ